MGVTQAAPIIFNYTKSVAPGQVISIQGSGFGANPEVWIQVVTTSATPTPTTQLTNIVNKSDTVNQGSYVAAEIPTSVPMGLYAVFVKNGASTSAYQWVNRPFATQVLDLAGTEIDPSRQFRLMGRNLKYSATATTVQFKNTSSGALTAATVPTQTADPYLLTVNAPASLTTGTVYEIVVNNGYGGTGANGDVSTGVTVTARAGGTDPFSLGVPWGADFSGAYANQYDVTSDSRITTAGVALAVPNDGIDDRPAIQKAIDLANTAGGGRVYLPAGTYDIANNIAMTDKMRVVVQGAGKTLTKIYCNATTTSGYIVTGFGSTNTMSYVGFADLGFEKGPSGPSGMMRMGASSGVKMILVRCKFYNGGVSASGSTNFLIQDCDIYGGLGTRHRDVLIRRNFVTWTSGRLNFYSDSTDSANPYCNRIQFDSNTFSRSVLRPPTGPQCGGLSLGGAQNVAIVNNTFDRLEGQVDGSGNPIYPTYYNTQIPESNDGETIMNENYPDSHLGVGAVTSATSTTITDTTETFGTSLLNANLGTAYVTIIQGPGVGQTRAITAVSGSQVTVSPAWDVTPTTASNYAIDRFDDNYLLKNNTFKEVNRGIWLCYSGTMENVNIVKNNMIDTNGIYVLGYSDIGWAPGRFNVMRDILVEGNALSSVRNWYAPQITLSGDVIGGSQIWGNHFYSVAVRDNSITGTVGMGNDGGGTGYGQGYNALRKDLSFGDDDSAAIHGALFDHNISINLSTAYAFDSVVHSATIWNSINNTGVDNILLDATAPNSGHASVNTAVAWSATSNVTPPYVWVTALSSSTVEGSLAPAKFRISRSGTSGNLVVSISKAGTVGAADYYETIGSTVTIPSGAQSVDVLATPIHDGIVEGNETFTLKLVSSASYNIGNMTATINFQDLDLTMVSEYVGTNTPSGSFSVNNGVFTLSANGTSLSAVTADNFRFAYNTLTGDGSITARVVSVSGGNGVWNQVGVMIREPDVSGNNTVGGRHVSSLIRPGQPTMYVRRTIADQASTSTNGSTITLPYWVRVTRVGDVFSVYRSTDGTWGSPVATVTIAMSAQTDIGLVVTSAGGSGNATATFDNVSTTGTINATPESWLNGDVGSVGVAGSATYDPDTAAFTIKGSGADIFGNVDAFQFVRREAKLSGDGTITAHLASIQNTHSTAKAGVMLRETTAAGSRHVMMAITPSSTGRFMFRNTTGGTTTSTSVSSGTAPKWVRLTRVGSVFTAAYSSDNVTWTNCGTVTITGMPTDLEVGLGVCSHANTVLCQGVFDNVSVTP